LRRRQEPSENKIELAEDVEAILSGCGKAAALDGGAEAGVAGSG
jgi:hypothetical protein